MKMTIEHKRREMEVGVGAGEDVAGRFCSMLLKNPNVDGDSITIDVYPMRAMPMTPPVGEHVAIEWNEATVQREPKKERRQSKWRRRTKWINTQTS